MDNAWHALLVLTLILIIINGRLEKFCLINILAPDFFREKFIKQKL